MSSIGTVLAAQFSEFQYLNNYFVTNANSLLSILYIFGISFWLSKGFTQRVHLGIINAIFLIIISIYISGLFGSIFLTTIALKLIGVAGFYKFITRKKNKQLYKLELTGTYIIAFSFFLFLLSLTDSYSIYQIIDDYSHWGKAAQVLLTNNRFVEPIDGLGVSDYPPAMAIFIYFIGHPTSYSIPLTLFAQAIFMVFTSSVLLVDFNSEKSFNKKIFLLTYTIAIYSIFWIFSHGFHTLWADLPLGFLFGISLFLHFRSSGKRYLEDYFSIAGAMAIMPLIKQIGLIFSAMSLFVIFIDEVMNKKYRDPFRMKFIFILVAVTLIAYISWDRHLSLLGISKSFSPNFKLLSILQAFNPSLETSTQHLIKVNFLDYMLTLHLSTYWFIVMLVSLVGVHINYRNRPTGSPSLVSIWQTIPLFVAYLLTLLVLYMFAFSEWDAVHLASIDRYILTFILGAITMALGLLISNLVSTEGSKNSSNFWISLVFVLCALPNLGRILIDTIYSFNPTFINKRDEYIFKKNADLINSTTNENSSIFLIWGNGNTNAPSIMRFFIKGRTLNYKCANIIPTYQSLPIDNPFSCHLYFDELKKYILSHDYLFIPDFDPEVEKNFLIPLGLSPSSYPLLYKIESSNQKIKLFTLNDQEK